MMIKLWLEEGEDYIYVEREFFIENFPSGNNFHMEKSGHKLVFLSPIGSIRLLSRTSKTNNVLYWLTVQHKELKLIQFEYYHEKTILEKIPTYFISTKRKLFLFWL